MDKLPKDSRDIVQHNKVDLYIHRPDNSFQGGQFRHVCYLSFTEFLSYYYVQSKTARFENDCQPAILNDEIMEVNHADSQFAKMIPLTTSKEKLKQRKLKAVL